MNVFAFDCDCDISYEYDSDRIAWIAELHHKYTYDQADAGLYISILSVTTRDSLIALLEENYSNEYAGFNGQVRYYRVERNGQYFSELDLYTGNIDISYYFEIDYFYPFNDSMFDSIYFSEIWASENNYFDPVLY